MAAITSEIILQTEQADGTFRCRAFAGVPAGRACWIAIVSSGSASGRAAVAELSDEVEAVLLGSSPEVARTEIECPCAPPLMQPADYPARRKVLVLVGTPDAKFQDLPWYGTWDSDDQDSGVMTVLRLGTFDNAFCDAILKDDQHVLRRMNASGWQKKIGEVLPGLLARAAITSSVSRVFISYRRVDTLPLALQLFDALTHEGFEVFLDRFSIPPGYDFQRRLNQELEDKSMVVLLESKSLNTSKWTQHEIDFAKRYRLGLVCLRMPDVTDSEALTSVLSKPRMALVPGDFTGPAVSGEWPKVTDDVCGRAVDFIKSAHAEALFERRHRLRQDVIAAFAAEGLTAQGGAAGPLQVACGADAHLVWLTTRPPEVDDFQQLYAAGASLPARTPGSRGFIVGPQAALEPDRRGRLDWLHKVSGCRSFDEGNLSDFARRVLAGVWP